MSDKVINGQLPARVSLGFRADKHLSFTGLDQNRSLPQCELTVAIKDLLQDIYADATACEGSTHIAKPKLGNHSQIRWATQGGARLRFYLSNRGNKKNKMRPKFETPADARTTKLRGMVQEAYDLARTKAQHAADEAARPVAKTAFEIEAEAYEKRLLAGEIVEPKS